MTELVPYAGQGLVIHEHARMTNVGLEIAPGTPIEELAEIAQGLSAINDAAQFAVGDTAAFMRDHFPDQYRLWIASPNPIAGLDNKTVKVYEAVSRFYSHEQRARHMTRYDGHPGVSHAHFSRLRRYGQEVAEHWLAKSAEEGISINSLEALLEEGAQAGADEHPAVPSQPTMRRGTYVFLGPAHDPTRHMLYCGSSKEDDLAAVMRIFTEQGHAPAKCAAVWTDPPYGVDYVSIGRQIKANKNWARDGGSREDAEQAAGILAITDDQAEALPELLQAAFGRANDICIPAAPFYVAGPSGQNMEQFLAAFRICGWDYKTMLIWNKNAMVFGRGDYHLKHEPVFYGYLPGDIPKGRIQELQGRAETSKDEYGTRWYGDNSQVSVFDISRPSRSDEHPTMKPTDLIRAQITNSTRPGDVVLDLFAGSGSTMIAADMTGRRSLCCELDERYADVIVARYQQYLLSPAGQSSATPPVVEATAEPSLGME